MLVDNNPHLYIPSKQRCSFMFDFLGEMLLFFTYWWLKWMTERPEQSCHLTWRRKQAHSKNIIILFTEPWFSDRKKVWKCNMWNKGWKTQTEVLSSCISSLAYLDSFYMWCFHNLKEISKQARKPNKMTFEQNMR